MKKIPLGQAFSRHALAGNIGEQGIEIAAGDNNVVRAECHCRLLLHFFDENVCNLQAAGN